MFIRFVVGAPDEDHRQLTGIVTEARLLRDRNELTHEEEQRLEAVYDWLNARLPCPPFDRAGWPSDAVSWFEDSATGAIQQFRILSAMLEHHGCGVRMLRSRNPGKVLYEDDYQVVVLEWKTL